MLSESHNVMLTHIVEKKYIPIRTHALVAVELMSPLHNFKIIELSINQKHSRENSL